MKNFKILVLALVLMPSLVVAQTLLDTSLDSSVTKTTSDGSIRIIEEYSETEDVKADFQTSDTDSTQTKTTTKTTETIIIESEPSADSTQTFDQTTDSSQTTTQTQETTVSNTQTTTTADSEKIRIVTDSLNTINEESQIIEDELRAEIKRSIDTSILDIRSRTNIEAYELQRVVDSPRNNIYTDINQTLKTVSPTDTRSIFDLQKRVENALVEITKSLEDRSGLSLDFSQNLVNIKNTFFRYQEVIEEKKELINSRQGDLLFKDSDGDGLSDFDEIFVYKTDPNNPNTAGGDLNDGQKVLRGINPADPDQTPIEYEDPREDRKSIVSKIHTVKNVELVRVDGSVGQRVRLEGTALPNSFVTLYIFSTPIIVTVKTDTRGNWTYTLDKELEDGTHNVYVTNVDNSGKIIARSEAIPFTKVAGAAILGTSALGIGQSSRDEANFIKDNFILIILMIFLFAVILVLILSGNRKDDDINIVNGGGSNLGGSGGV